MGELIVQRDSYVKEFESSIIDIDKGEKAVVLDRTIFYPEEDWCYAFIIL